MSGNITFYADVPHHAWFLPKLKGRDLVAILRVPDAKALEHAYFQDILRHLHTASTAYPAPGWPEDSKIPEPGRRLSLFVMHYDAEVCTPAFGTGAPTGAGPLLDGAEIIDYRRLVRLTKLAVLAGMSTGGNPIIDQNSANGADKETT